MAIPDFQTIMLPLLKFAGDGEEHHIRNAHDALAKEFKLTEEELAEKVSSGRVTKFYDRVSWARTYLVQACLLESTRRAHFRITERGQEVLPDPPEKIDIPFLRQYEEFIDFQQRGRKENPIAGASSNGTEYEGLSSETPREAFESAYRILRAEVESEILRRIMQNTPKFFEDLVIDIWVAMGYGGSREEAQAVGRSGDEGIDGVIKQDKFGLDTIYVQAKRWEGSVGRPEIQKFVGALEGQRANKGIFVITSSFTKDAEEYTRQISSKVILIDGKALVEYMFDYGLGVTTTKGYFLKKIDTDYFEEDDGVA